MIGSRVESNPQGRSPFYFGYWCKPEGVVMPPPPIPHLATELAAYDTVTRLSVASLTPGQAALAFTGHNMLRFRGVDGDNVVLWELDHEDPIQVAASEVVMVDGSDGTKLTHGELHRGILLLPKIIYRTDGSFFHIDMVDKETRTFKVDNVLVEKL